MNNVAKFVKSLILILAITAGLSYVFAWVGPAQNPPNGNVPAPITTLAVNQVKSGSLVVTDFVADSVTVGSVANPGAITAPKFCIGNNCITAWNWGNASCELPWGSETLEHGGSATAYQSASSPNCASISETRICTNGTLSGTYTNPSCATCTAANQSTNMCSGYYFQVCEDKSFGSLSADCTGYNQAMSKYCASKNGTYEILGSCNSRQLRHRCTCN